MTQESSYNIQNEACATCLAKEPVQVSRRSFFASLLGVGCSLIATVIGIPTLRLVFYPVLAVGDASKWTVIGDASEFDNLEAPVTKTISLTQRDGWRDVVSLQSVVVNRSTEGGLQVLSPICPHLGCSIAWHSARTNSSAPATAVNSARTEDASQARPRADWTSLKRRSRTAS